MVLTQRQQREVDYHREHAKTSSILDSPFPYDVLTGTRWWNAYWEMFRYLRTRVAGKSVLVVGCGYGDDAVRLAKLGARVTAIDLSHESLAIANKLAAREGVQIDFREEPAEKLTVSDGTFDVIVARDILHHVDVERSVNELRRVSKQGAVWVIDEIYSHSITETVRRSWLVEKALYPLMQRFVYGTDKPYITEDERKLNELEIAAVTSGLTDVDARYFNFVTTRLVPERWDFAAKLDRIALIVLKPIACFLAGRVLIVGRRA